MSERTERGSAAVEFALVLPFLLVMILALLQVGLLARDRLVVEAASRAGARGKFKRLTRAGRGRRRIVRVPVAPIANEPSTRRRSAGRRP